MSEDRDTMVRRLRMRSMRRGIKEMDLILTDFADAALDRMSPEDLATYDALLHENDHDIFGWILGQAAPPDQYSNLMVQLTDRAQGIVKQS